MNQFLSPSYLPRRRTRMRACAWRFFVALALVPVLALPLAAQYELPQLVEGFGEDFHTSLGWSVSGLGDINGDGWPDVGVSVYYKRELRIYFGGPGILDSIPDLILPGGTSARMADMNGDGNKELCVVKAKPGTGVSRDTLLIFLGRPGPGLRIDTTPSIVFAEPKPGGADLGYYMATGDLNGDGFTDLVVSARAAHIPPEPNGTVYVFLGRPVLDTLPDFIGKDWRPDRTTYGQGCWVDDVNGDGFDDLVVGGRHYSRVVPGSDYGLISLYLGGPQWIYDASQPDQTLDASSFGLSRDSCTWFQMGSVFDANGDGRADYLFFCNHPEGRNYGIFANGTNFGFSTTPGRTIDPAYRWRYFAAGARRIGDINGDGYRDFAFPMAYGVVHYSLGNVQGFENRPRAISHDYPGTVWDSYGCNIPQRLDDVGDINGDGADDVIVSHYSESPNIAYGYFHIVAGNRRFLVGVPAPPPVPGALAVGPAWPNPTHAFCAFEVELAAAGTVHVTVHDLLGRSVRTLEQRELPAGTHTLQWDGHLDEGRAAPPGVYWYRVTCAGTVGTGKVVLR